MDRKLCSEDLESQDEYDDASVDMLYDNITRSDEKELRKKELMKKSRSILRKTG